MHTPFATAHTARFRLLAVLVGTVLMATPVLAACARHASAAPACVTAEQAQSNGYDAATKNDAAFNKDFRHCFTTVDGVQMHYVIGGSGSETMVLLHGWPENWYEFRAVMPDLLPGRTVIAIDLPGMGDSSGRPPAYTKTTLATYIHELLTHLGKTRDVQVVAHDFGVGVAYALAAQHREQVAGLFLMDFPLVGKNLTFDTVRPLSWHFSFNLQKPLAETLVAGQVEAFLTYFFQHSQIAESGQSTAAQPVPVAPDSLAEYTRVFSRDQVLHAGFELYRTWAQDEVENKRLQNAPLTIPVRLVTQDGFLNVMLPPVRDAAPAATGLEFDAAGHWLVDERPEDVVDEINAFFPPPR